MRCHRPLLFLAAVALWAGGVVPVQAHPPSKMVLQYHADRQVLTVSLEHITHNLRRHRIRQLTVVKNGDAPVVLNFPRQEAAAGLTAAVPLKAQPGDVIHVTAICNQGGVLEGALTVEAPEE